MSVKVLYIEDNDQNMRLVRKILLHAGYEFCGAETGLAGIDMAYAEQPDIILVDINLPDIDGLEVTRRLKSGELAHIPVIALTANAMVGDKERSLDAGCDAYMPKPVGRHDLLAMLEQFLTR
jgi:two-component system cell cycle response regulator DivK